MHGTHYSAGLGSNPSATTIQLLRLAHLVERLVWDHEAASSSLAAETIKRELELVAMRVSAACVMPAARAETAHGFGVLHVAFDFW